MCNRYTPSSYEDPNYKTERAANPVNYPPQPWLRMGPYANGPFVRPNSEGRLIQVVGQWGMIRPGAPARREFAQDKKPRMTNNARSETMAKLTTFRQAWANGRRCIVPAASFDEPNWETKKNVWWEFRRADRAMWGIAGLWSEWTDPASGEIVPNYTMVTCNADHHPLMSRMHKHDPSLPDDAQDKRSIVPLDPAHWQTWLFGSNDEAFDLIRLPPVEVFDAGPAPAPPPRQKPPGSVKKQLVGRLLNPDEEGGQQSLL